MECNASLSEGQKKGGTTVPRCLARSFVLGQDGHELSVIGYSITHGKGFVKSPAETPPEGLAKAAALCYNEGEPTYLGRHSHDAAYAIRTYHPPLALPATITRSDASSLRSLQLGALRFGDTVPQWRAVKKGESRCTSSYFTVQCTDGKTDPYPPTNTSEVQA